MGGGGTYRNDLVAGVSALHLIERMAASDRGRGDRVGRRGGREANGANAASLTHKFSILSCQRKHIVCINKDGHLHPVPEDQVRAQRADRGIPVEKDVKVQIELGGDRVAGVVGLDVVEGLAVVNHVGLGGCWGGDGAGGRGGGALG